MTDASPAQRHVQRHNQISIRLHYRLEADWHRVEAQQWNERGFCFFHTHALNANSVAFNPNFPLARPRRMMGGEFDWQVKRFGLLPKPLHPLPVLHGQRQIQYGLAALGGGVGGFGK